MDTLFHKRRNIEWMESPTARYLDTISIRDYLTLFQSMFLVVLPCSNLEVPKEIPSSVQASICASGKATA